MQCLYIPKGFLQYNCMDYHAHALAGTAVSLLTDRVLPCVVQLVGGPQCNRSGDIGRCSLRTCSMFSCRKNRSILFHICFPLCLPAGCLIWKLYDATFSLVWFKLQHLLSPIDFSPGKFHLTMFYFHTQQSDKGEAVLSLVNVVLKAAEVTRRSSRVAL